jgi:hypothetical protein
MQLPDTKEFTDTWQDLAAKEGLTDGIYFVAVHDDPSPLDHGFSAYMDAGFTTEYNKIKESFVRKLKRKLFGIRRPELIDYRKLVEENLQKSYQAPYMPVVIPNWDNTPRSGYNGRVFMHASTELFEKWLRYAAEKTAANNPDERLLFIKSWNEWAEGNYLEPDQLHGTKYLEIIKKVIFNRSSVFK